MLDGFEHGIVANGNQGVPDVVSGTPAIVTSPVRTGARALQIDTTSLAEYYGYNVPAGNRVATMSFYIRFPSLPAADAQLAFATTGTSMFLYYHQSTNRFAVRDTTSGAFVDDTTVVAINT